MNRNDVETVVNFCWRLSQSFGCDGDINDFITGINNEYTQFKFMNDMQGGIIVLDC